MLACRLIEQKKEATLPRFPHMRAESRSVAWSWFTASAEKDAFHAIRRFPSVCLPSPVDVISSAAGHRPTAAAVLGGVLVARPKHLGLGKHRCAEIQSRASVDRNGRTRLRVRTTVRTRAVVVALFRRLESYRPFDDCAHSSLESLTEWNLFGLLRVSPVPFESPSFLFARCSRRESNLSHGRCCGCLAYSQSVRILS